MKNVNRLFSTIALIVSAGLLIFYGFTLFSGRGERDRNPYEYNVDSFKGADSSLVRYTELEEIDFSGKKLSALTLNQDETLPENHAKPVVVATMCRGLSCSKQAGQRGARDPNETL